MSFLLLFLLFLAGISNCQRLSQGASDWYMRFHDFDMVKRHVDRVAVQKFHVNLDIRHRYAIATVHSQIHNPSLKRQLYEFGFAMPQEAFVSQVQLEQLNHLNEVINTVEARARPAFKANRGFSGESREGDQGQNAEMRGELGQNERLATLSSLVSGDQPDFKQFVLPMNISGNGSVAVKLVYETLLQRNQGLYESSINVSPGEIVANLSISVRILEAGRQRQIRRLNISAPVIGEVTSSALINNSDENRTNSEVELNVSMSSVEQFHYFGAHGFTGSFRVAFDVDVENPDVYVQNGHFLHFYDLKQRPNMPSIPRYVIFAVENSESLSGPKLEYAQQSLQLLLETFGEEDRFSMIAFNNDANILVQNNNNKELRSMNNVNEERFLFPVSAATSCLDALFAALPSNASASNLTTAVDSALFLDNIVWEQLLVPDNAYTLVIVLTDGRSHKSINEENRVRRDIRALNKLSRVPLFFLGLGFDANMDLLESLSVNFNGLAVNVNEDLELEPQLESLHDHLNEIVLKNAHVNYIAAAVRPESVTKSHFKAFPAGGALSVSGRFDAGHPDLELETEVTGQAAESLYMDSPEPISLINTEDEDNIEVVRRKRLHCVLTLCSEVALRGNCIELKTSRATLKAFSFSNQPASASVQGVCNWTLYSSVHYSGSETLKLIEGEYVSLKHMHKNVESVKRVPKAIKESPFSPNKSVQSNLWIQRAWAFLRLKDQLELLETRPNLMSNKAIRKAALLATRFNFLTAFTDMHFGSVLDNVNDRNPSLIRNEAAAINHASSEEENGFSTVSLMRYADLTPPMSDDPELSLQWDALRTCQPPIECRENFHFEMDHDFMDDFDSENGLNCSQSSLTLFSRAHYRGDKLSTGSSLHQIYHNANGHIMRSLIVEGHCCWLLFERRFYAGDVERVCGDTKRPIHLRHVASVKRVRPRIELANQGPRGHAALY